MNLAAQEMAERPLLNNKTYLSLLGSQIVSNLGEWLTILAILTLVGLKWEATPWQITGLTLCMLLPMLLGGPLAGMLADRVERKQIMVWADIIRIFVVLSMIFVQEIWQMYLLLIAKSIFDVMFGPAKSGKIKEIVPRSQLEQAVSYSAIIEQSCKIAGPALGGLLTAMFGLQACFVLNALTFLISALFLFRVPSRSKLQRIAGEQPEAGRGEEVKDSSSNVQQGFLKELAAGIQTIARIPVLAYGLLALALVLAVLQIADSQTVVLFREIRNLPDDMLGWCIALSGVGTLLAAVLVRLLKSWSPLAKMGAGSAVMGIMFFLASWFAEYLDFGKWSGITAMILSFMIVGLGAGMTFIPFQTELQKRTPERLTGRVFGTVNSILSSASLIGPLVGGYLVTSFGAFVAFKISGGLVAALGLVLLVSKTVIMKRDHSVHVQKEGEKAAVIAPGSAG
ncbi:MFS transporter [Paenibacillus physcomitrellae]|uniref:MFS-type transporter YfiS n=1 Tax=Paenibacillus physcomitrellae TaxID=1619311 RepID=A0ABQ1FWK4_9BACL|nr:MFS transporter [Paenibacillus physcomitrellae]GGA32662.1 putative MFS-type transporter YfiS [Paenibacillus physcomitrellae]